MTTCPYISARRGLGVLVAVAALGALAPSANAFPEHRRLLRVRYQQPVGCGACHEDGGGSALNPYGEAWERAGGSAAALDAIADQDADGDGIRNGAELEGGANPGDARSTPAVPGRRWQIERRAVPIPAAQLELVLGVTDRLEAAEVELTPAQIAFAEAGLGRALGAAARVPTLYFGVTAGARASVALFAYDRRRDGSYAVLIGATAAGAISRIALFRAGAAAPERLRPYLDCLAGHTRDQVPAIGACPVVAGLEATQRVVGASIQEALWVAAAALQEGAPVSARREVPLVHAASSGADPASSPPAAAELALDLAAVETTAQVQPTSTTRGTALALLALVLFLGVVAASARVARPRFGQPTPTPWLTRLTPPQLLLCALATASLVLALVGGAIAAYVRVTASDGTAAAYFHQMSAHRLLGLSHAHVFGYTICYGTLAALACASTLPERWKSVLVAALMWAGPFDVLSWWGLQQLSPRFELLTTVTGLTSAAACVVALVAIGRDLVRALGRNEHA